MSNSTLQEELNKIFIFSAKHVGQWDERMTKNLRKGKISNLYLNLPSLTEALESYILKREKLARVDELSYVVTEMTKSDSDYISLRYFERRLAELEVEEETK